MATFNTTESLFPTNTRGMSFKLPSGTADGIWIQEDSDNNLWQRVMSNGAYTYNSAWLNTVGNPSDKTTLLNELLADARSQVFHVDADITVNGTVNCQGKTIMFSKGGVINGTGTLQNAVIYAGYDYQILDINITLEACRLSSNMFSVKWYGATGSGFGDDQPAIQKSVDTMVANPNTMPRDLYYPIGNYRILMPIITYDWDGTNYRFTSLNHIGQQNAHWSRESNATRISPAFNDKFVFGFQRCRASIVKGFYGQGVLNIAYPTGNGAAYFEADYATWVSGAGVRDNQFSPYAFLVIDPFTQLTGSYPIPVSGGDPSNPVNAYPDLHEWYRGEGTNGGSSGIRMSECRINGFTVGIIISPNAMTLNGENCYFSEISIENCKVAYASTQRQEKNNSLRNLISWDRVHTILDGVSYGQQRGCPPNIDGWNIAGQSVVRLFNVQTQFSWTVRNIFGEQVYRIGNLLGAYGPITIEGMYVDFLQTALTPTEHIKSTHTKFIGCTLRYYDDLFDKRMLVDGSDTLFDNCWFDLPPLKTRFEDQRGSIEYNHCYTERGLIGPKYFSGHINRTPIIYPTQRCVVKRDIEDNPTFIRDHYIELEGTDFNHVQYFNTFSDLSFTLNESNRTATMAGSFNLALPVISGDGCYTYLLVHNSTKGTSMVFGRVTAADGASVTVDHVPWGVSSGDVFTAMAYAKVRRLTPSILYDAHGTTELTNLNGNSWGGGLMPWPGVEIAGGFIDTFETTPSALFNMTLNTGANGTDFYKPGWGNPGDGSFKETIIATVDPDQYMLSFPIPDIMVSTDTIWIAMASNIGTASRDRKFVFTKGGFLNAAGIGSTRQAVWTIVEEPAATPPNYADDTAADNAGVRIYYNTTSSVLKKKNGATWSNV